MIIKRAEERDLPAILELQRIALGEGTVPRTEEFWRWKHENNPFGKSSVLLAWDGDTLAGLRVFMRWEWIKDWKIFKAVRAVDTATHPDYQGRGLFKKLTLQLCDEMKSEGVDFVFNTPNDKSGPGYLKMGWESAGKLNVMARPSNWTRILKKTTQIVLGRNPYFESRPPGIAPYGIKRLFHEPEAEAIIERIASEYRGRGCFYTRKSYAYLRWRYELIPGYRYYAFYDFEEGKNFIIIFRILKQNVFSELRICEMIMDNDYPIKKAKDILNSMIRLSGAQLITALKPMEEYKRKTLSSVGLIGFNGRGPELMVRPLVCEETAMLKGLNHWSPEAGNLEIF